MKRLSPPAAPFPAAALAVFGVAVSCGAPAAQPPPDEPPVPPLRTPRWAFEPWISKDISDAADLRAFVQGFRDRGIPVGAVVVDSPWETQYNTFVPDEARYPGFLQMIAELRAQGVRTVCWTTQMVNEWSLDLEPGGSRYDGPSPNFQEARDRGFLVNGGETYLWWKGSGGGIDFFHPEARRWWHAQQDALLAAGLAGWKLDFGEEYIRTDPVRTHAGEVSHRSYSEAYYRDFLAWGVHRAGPDFVTMVRPWDESYGFPGRFFARPEHAPVAWVGDNRRDWKGLADALDHIFRSAAAGYTVLGSDIGGYLDRDDLDLGEPVAWDAEVFLRWTALGALTPFMELHGRANIAPWTVPERTQETVDAWRFWATLHHQLVPFFHSLAAEAQTGRGRVLVPVGEPSQWPGDYRFRLGDALLAAPILSSSPRRTVALPEGSQWYDWWDPAADPVEGGRTVEAVAEPSLRIPLYAAAGAIVPAEVDSEAAGLGTERPAGALTLLVWPAGAGSLVVHEPDGSTLEVRVGREGETLFVSLSRVPRSVVLRVRADAAPGSVRANGAAIAAVSDAASFESAAQAWRSETAAKRAWVRLAPSAVAVLVTLEP